jgi:Domain of Unknown Function with PDB structure (DUF3857)
VGGDSKLGCVERGRLCWGCWATAVACALSFVLSGAVVAQGPVQAAPASQSGKPAEAKPAELPAASQAGKPAENKRAEVPAASQTANPAEAKPAEAKAPELPAQIELLEARVRFEVNGDSRKEVHTRVHINNELGVRQFARLNFDYNRSFQQVELPLLRITHVSGGTADILPSAITDQPNPAVVNFPAYHDVRVKSVRILGLEPGDVLEYRVVTTTTHHPLAPDFWLDHSFDRSGVVSHEVFELDLPVSAKVHMRIGTATPVTSSGPSGGGGSERIDYKWDLVSSRLADKSLQAGAESDVAITTFSSWPQLSSRLWRFLYLGSSTQIWADSMKLTGYPKQPVPDRLLYDLVRTKIATIDLPLDFSRFPLRQASEILSSRYGRPEEKIELLSVLHGQQIIRHPLNYRIVAYTELESPEERLPTPSLLKGLLLDIRESKTEVYLDPALDVAPFGALPANVRGKGALVLGVDEKTPCWTTIPLDLPYPSVQRVNVDATLDANGSLSAKVRYAMRGDNELLLRVAFHQAPKEKWKEVAQLLALSDGFRGKVTSVTASDPYATKEPFTVEYEITQAKFVDWSKKPVRIPALLPLVALPDLPAKGGAGSPAIELGTPLDVQTRVTLRVPPDTSVSAPAGTSVERDYATFASEYSARNLTLTAERHIKFLLREVSAEHAADYAAFVRSVQSDQAQEFTLERGDAAAPRTTPARARSAVSSHP